MNRLAFVVAIMVCRLLLPLRRLVPVARHDPVPHQPQPYVVSTHAPRTHVARCDSPAHFVPPPSTACTIDPKSLARCMAMPALPSFIHLTRTLTPMGSCPLNSAQL